MTLIIEKLMIEIIKKYKSNYRTDIKNNNIDLDSNYNYYQYLYVINKYDGINQNELAERMNVLKSSSSKAVKNLLENNLITIMKDDNDLRIKNLYITKKGKILLKEFTGIISKANSRLLKGFSKEEIKQVKSFLIRIYQNINSDTDSSFINNIRELDINE